MEIQIDPHTLERAEERGTNEAEIKDVIHTGFSIPLPNMGELEKLRFTNLSKTVIISIMNKNELKYSISLKEIRL